MAYSAITDAEIAVGKPIRPPMVKVKDNFEYLYSQTGAPPMLPINGSFELDTDSDGEPDNWTQSLYSGGSAGLETTSPADGAQAAYFTHPGGAGNGGGYLTSDYIECSQVATYWLYFIHWATAAGMKNIVRISYFTAAKVAVSSSDIYSSTSNPTNAALFCEAFTPPSTARYMKIVVIGGYTDTDVAGTAYFDGLRLIPAPYSGMILEAMYGANSVDQTALKTTTGSVSTSGIDATVTIPGGSYAFYPQGRYNGLAGSLFSSGAVLTTSYATLAHLTVGSSSTGYLQSRYFQSSPPYNFGDGNAMGFVYLDLDNNGDMIGSWIAPDPPWYGNGRQKARKLYKALDGKEYAEFRQSKFQRTGLIEDYGEIELVVEEITSESKLVGMDEFPQPFLSGGSNIVLLDPVDEDLTRRIVNEMLVGGDSIEIFKQGYVHIDNTKLSRKGPPNIAIHQAKWK